MSPPRDIIIDGSPPDLGVDISAFIGATSISFVVADPSKPDTPIVYVNRAFELTTGYSHRFVVGRNCRFLQGPDTDPEAVRNIAVALGRGEGVRQTLLNYRADGTEFVNDLVITPIKNASGGVAYFVGVQREVDRDAPDAEEALRTRTIDIVRQQVQHHLSVVMQMGRVHMRGEDDTSGGTQDDFIHLMRRLEILDLLYENLNQKPLQDDRLDAGAYLGQITAALVARIPRAGVRVNISTESAVVPLDIAVRLGIVLAELVETSLSESFNHRDEGQLEVSLSNNDGEILLSVYDDGDAPRSAKMWLSSGELTPRMITRLMQDMGATIGTPDVDLGREVTVRVPRGGRP